MCSSPFFMAISSRPKSRPSFLNGPAMISSHHRSAFLPYNARYGPMGCISGARRSDGIRWSRERTKRRDAPSANTWGAVDGPITVPGSPFIHRKGSLASETKRCNTGAGSVPRSTPRLPGWMRRPDLLLAQMSPQISSTTGTEMASDNANAKPNIASCAGTFMISLPKR
jgi:hypothetical protein